MNDSSKPCPICGAGNLCSKIGKNSVEYRGQTRELDIYFSLCDGCGSEQADATQIRNNKRLMVAFKKQVDGLLMGSEVRALREKLGLSQAMAAQLFGGGPVAFSKYESDDVTQSEAMDKLLCLSDELPAAFELLCRKSGIEHEKPWQNIEDLQVEPDNQIERPKLRILSTSTLNLEQQEARYVA